MSQLRPLRELFRSKNLRGVSGRFDTRAGIAVVGAALVGALWPVVHAVLGSEREIAIDDRLGAGLATGLIMALTLALVMSCSRHRKITRAIEQRDAEQRQVEAALIESHRRFRMLFEQAPVGIAISSPSGVMLDANPAFLKMFGRDIDELQGSHAIDHCAVACRKQMTEKLGNSTTAPIDRCIRNGAVLRKNGDIVPVVTHVAPIQLPDGLARVCFSIDVTDRKRMEQEADRSKERLDLALQGSNLALWDYDLSSGAVYLSKEWKHILGEEQTEITTSIGALFELVHPEEREQLNQLRVAVLKGETPVYEVEHRVATASGEWIWIHSRGKVVERDSCGKALRMAGTNADITERKRNEERLTYLAQYDTLTGLPNRHLLYDRLMLAMARARRNQQLMALILLGMDRFKEINDTFGRGAGDRVLQTVTARLKDCLRDVDTIARLAGDEFTVVLEGINAVEEIVTVAHKIRDSLSDPVLLEGREIFLTASIGIATYPSEVDDVEGVLKQADFAMYHAKGEGRNTYQFYRAELRSKQGDRLGLEAQLRRALQREEFVLHYQPQVELKTGRIVGAEALLRWRHPERGMIPPSAFIPLAEETGLIVPIGEWVLRTACAHNRALQDAGHAPIVMAINLSARQFREKNLVDVIGRSLKDTGLDPRYLELEITESMLVHQVEEVVATLGKLSQMGIQLSIDDFGTGYSSLSYLRRFPVQKLKIDQSFVRDITSNPDDAAIALAVIAMAHSLKLKVIVEGLETKEQLDYLRRHDCDEMQGYYFSRPLPPEELACLLREGRILQLPVGRAGGRGAVDRERRLAT